MNTRGNDKQLTDNKTIMLETLKRETIENLGVE